MGNVIMAIGAHTADAQLSCGMLLAKHAMAGDKIITVDLTAGERGTMDGYSTAEFREINIQGSREFARTLGGESIVFDVPDCELYAGKEIEMRLARLMREKQVTHVLYHWKNSFHKDHVNASIISRNAAWFAALPSVELDGLPPAPIRQQLYAENWEDSEGFEPLYYFDVTEAFPLWKEAAKNIYVTQHSGFCNYIRVYEAMAILRGNIIKTQYATAYAPLEHKRFVRQDLLV